MTESSRHFRLKLLFGLWIFMLGLGVVYTLYTFLLPLVLGGLLALLIHPLVDYLEARYEFSRPAIIGVVFGAFLSLGLVLTYSIGPLIAKEVKDFQNNRSVLINSISSRYLEVKAKIKKESPRLYQMIPWKSIEKKWVRPDKWLAKGRLSGVWDKLTKGVGWLFNFLLLTPMFAFFVLKDGLALKKWLLQFVPNQYFEMVMELIYNVNSQIVAFVRGQFWDSAINAVILSSILTLVGLPYSILVGTFAGLANAVPVLGPITAGSVGILVAVLTGSVSPWLIAVIFLVVHLFDVVWIYPSTVGHSLHLHELIVILAVFTGGYVAGIIGMFVAVPLLGIAFRSTQIVFRTLRGYRII